MKVGVITVIGFAVGVTWPRLAGVRLGPSAPNEAAAPALAASARASDPASPASLPSAAAALASAGSTVVVGSAPVEPPASSRVKNASVVNVGHGVVISCRTDDGDSLKGAAACGGLGGFDAIAQPRLRKLVSCPPSAGASGKLSAVFSLDFKSNRVGVDVGRASTVGNTEAFASCLRSAFQGVSLGPIAHDHPRYAVAYAVKLVAPDAESAASTPPAPVAANPSPTAPTSSEADGTAEVVWEIALVRDAPRTGQVVGRLPRGSKVRLGPGDDGWYHVKFGSGFASDGFLYRGALGR